MSEKAPHLNDLEDGIVRLRGLASATYWLGRANEDPDREAVRTLGECMEEAAADLQRKWERLYPSQQVRP